MSDTTLRRWRSQDALGTDRPHVSRHPVREVNVYEVKEYELEQLSNAAHTPTHLSFSMFFLSNAVTSIACLATATFRSEAVRAAFLFMAAVGFAFGAIFLSSWLRTRARNRRIAERIRKRPPEDWV